MHKAISPLLPVCCLSPGNVGVLGPGATVMPDTGYAQQLKVVAFFQMRDVTPAPRGQGSMIALLNTTFYTELRPHLLAQLRLLSFLYLESKLYCKTACAERAQGGLARLRTSLCLLVKAPSVRPIDSVAAGAGIRQSRPLPQRGVLSETRPPSGQLHHCVRLCARSCARLSLRSRSAMRREDE